MSKAVDFMLELRTKSVEDLIKLGEDRRAELFALKFQAAVGSLEQTHRIPSLKKDIARIEMLLNERKNAGEDINKTIKADYSKAVEEAEKAGKEVRKKHKEMIEKLQNEQFGTGSEVSEDAIMAAMQNATQDSNDAPVELEVKKPSTKTSTTKQAAPKKEAAPKVEEKEAAPKKATTTKSTETKEAVKKPAAAKPAAAKTGEAKATGKGKAALDSVEVKALKVGVAKGEDIEGIDLKLSKKPKDAKTYTFGSNAEEAKKQIEEANKKIAEKKAAKTTTTKGAK
ncbi:50S ribosomal protein L29 [Spiroplasma diminutum CUAS-1]|uniref:Large ribosomal subunit protein uL29 n=1 Tax=Spiroplasma diminutum CUAS-1 TaxID=1276221 RepID=S5M0U9_9MOLU|nr:50S ribosomal protein L29 [Spiroplasma diminutum]AGR42476.1 50S ribosomal protein L29 [Spiroplasma diminutum CUAS-1]